MPYYDDTFLVAYAQTEAKIFRANLLRGKRAYTITKHSYPRRSNKSQIVARQKGKFYKIS